MKLTKKSREEIFTMVQEGVGKGAIAAKFGTSVAQVSKIEREFSPSTKSDELGIKDTPLDPVTTPSEPSTPIDTIETVESPETPSSTNVASGTCARCGKPLSKDSSVEAGMGDICQGHVAALAGLSFESYREYKASLELEKEPDDFWLPLAEAIKIANEKHGITLNRFMCAIGENRALKPPIDTAFQIRWWHNKRYVLRKVVMQNKYITLLEDSYEVRRQLEKDGVGLDSVGM